MEFMDFLNFSIFNAFIFNLGVCETLKKKSVKFYD